MVADDDIIISTESLNNLFELIAKEKFTILVPAFSRFGKISHQTTERKLRSEYRITNFAEVTCPIFNTPALMDFMDIYRPELGQCFGVDWWYLDFFKKTTASTIAISDKFYCINPYEFTKGTATREIDSHYSDAQRWKLWEAMKLELQINSFKKEIYAQKNNTWFTVLRMAPLFLMEIMFDRIYKLLKGNGFLRMFKKNYLKFKARTITVSS